MKKIVFVILHYQNINDTINCVDSILSLNNSNCIDFEIVVVDNKSPNNSGIELKQKYENNKNINIILMESNLGFSKANNIGFVEANKLNPDVILVLNNDIIFEDKNFIENLEIVYKENKDVSILCPDIININGMHQNPLKKESMSIKKAYKNYFYNRIICFLLCVPLIRNLIYKFEKRRSDEWMNNYYNENQDVHYNDFVPFGAFVIYMNDWLNNENIAFPSDTFMYMEEDYMSLYIKKNNYKISYEPKLKVRHLEGRSVEASNDKEYERLKFKYKNVAIALKKYINFYKKLI